MLPKYQQKWQADVPLKIGVLRLSRKIHVIYLWKMMPFG
ncbi:Uncharacterised protein [Mycobacteroides abscessus subsp. abscessus]|nr:Uncharacterised protein [Mycobacteroides abscessus subsp. abscessus]